jgi:hypothetical protein
MRRGYFAPEPRVPSTIHFTHTSCTDGRHDFIGTKFPRK